MSSSKQNKQAAGGEQGAQAQPLDEMQSLLEQHHNSERLLPKGEEQFRLLVTGVQDYAIFMLDVNGYIASWNQGAQLIKGYTAEEAIGQHFSIFYPPEDIAARKPERELETATREGTYKEEGWRLRKDGTPFWASVVITALRGERGILRGFGKVTRDLTERKQAEDAQLQIHEQRLQIAREQAAREQAEADLRLRDAFLSSAAHELRTPVTSMFGYAQILQQRFDRGELTRERFQRPINTITLQARRLERLTTMLLDITRLEYGKLTPGHTPIDVRRAIEQVTQELQLLTEQHTITLNFPTTPLIVAGDELRFEQVIYNLVQNAIKYSAAGGVITVTARQEAQHAVITVSDQGIGIPPEDLPYVFERFYRATNIPQGTISGLGLGLYLVKEFVGLQGGTVEAHSAPDQGTTFRITLPLLGE